MKTFEEKLTAWVDGRLAGEELAAFERELEASPQALARALAEDEAAGPGIGNLLRTHLAPAPLRNADFFNHQLLQQLEAARPREPEPASRRRSSRSIFWTLPRMALSGAFLLALSTVLYYSAVPNTRREVKRNERYVANVLNARTDDPTITATSFHSKEQNVNVLWLDGVNYTPTDPKLK